MSVMLPISEEFTSLQGEGQWTGTLMRFIRLAGCTVGRPEMLETDSAKVLRPDLKTGKKAWLCHTYDNRPFWCDTDFNKYYEKSVEELLQGVGTVQHICITGGEPLMHRQKLAFLVEAARHVYKVHIETSGTIELPDWPGVWFTVSPKFNVLLSSLKRADEIKLLIDEHFTEDDLPLFTDGPIWVQPINFETTVNPDNVKRCIDLIHKHPNWRLSVQLHKYLNVR